MAMVMITVVILQVVKETQKFTPCSIINHMIENVELHRKLVQASQPMHLNDDIDLSRSLMKDYRCTHFG